MITLEKLIVYEKHGGDSDGLGRWIREPDVSVMPYQEWMEIDRLIQELCLIKENQMTDEYAKRVQDKVARELDGPEALKKLQSLADNPPKKFRKSK